MRLLLICRALVGRVARGRILANLPRDGRRRWIVVYRALLVMLVMLVLLLMLLLIRWLQCSGRVVARIVLI